METVLITGSINVPKSTYVKIDNPIIRLKQYLSSLICWIEDPQVHALVFCENSSYNFNYEPILKLAKRYNKEFEPLIFNGNAGVEKGKYIGERRILDFACRNSKLLGYIRISQKQ